MKEVRYSYFLVWVYQLEGDYGLSYGNSVIPFDVRILTNGHLLKLQDAIGQNIKDKMGDNPRKITKLGITSLTYLGEVEE
jgi:hypothetical protein